MSAPNPSGTSDAILVPRARLAEVKAEIDQLRAERDRLAAELAAVQEEHRNLKSHLTGSIREVARLTDELARLREG